MSVVLMHPSGNNFVRALLQAMQEEDMLAEFNTAIAVDPNSSLLKLLPENMRNELLRRSFSVPKDKIHLYPVREVARLVLPRLGFAGSVRHEIGWAIHRSLGVLYRFQRGRARRYTRFPYSVSLPYDSPYVMILSHALRANSLPRNASHYSGPLGDVNRRGARLLAARPNFP